jgi:sarcosine oxidase, subunit beta
MADVAVIGGGLAGCATAYYLAADGVDVILLEQDDLNTRASGTNAGSLHLQIPHDTFVALGDAWARAFLPAVQLFAESVELWRGVEGLLGVDLDIAMPGGLLVAADEAQLRHIERKAAFERAAGVEIEILDRAALRARAPYISGKMLGAAFCPQEGKADPLRAASAYGQAAARLGAQVMSRTTVRNISRANGGFVLETTGGPVRAARIVNAAGADADAIAALLGVHLRLPLQRYPIQLSVTEPVTPLIEHLVYYAAAPLTLKQTHAGTILIGGGWPARLDARGRPVVDPLSLAANLGYALDVVPRLARVNVVRTWAAIVNGTDDWLPQLGEVPGHAGFFMCYVPWLGFTAGPAAAWLVARQVQGRASPLQVDPAAFRPGVKLSA